MYTKTIFLVIFANYALSHCNIIEIKKDIRNLETKCDKGYYLNGKDCFECYEKCLDCNGINCIECEAGFYPSQMNCYKCYLNCIECDGIKCTKCIQGYYPINMDCYECYTNCIECDGEKCNKCIKGYYPNNMDCYQCHENCLECDGNICTSCKDNYIPYKMDCLSGNKNSCKNAEGYYMLKKDYIEFMKNQEYIFICLSKAIIGNGYFISSEMKNDTIYYFWEKCSSNCLECDGTEENNCLICDGESYYKLYEDKLKTNNFKCYEEKEKINYFIYEENSIKYLRKCSDNCLTCLNYTNNKCTTCDNINYFFKYEDIQNIINGAQCFSQNELPNYYLYKNQYFKECIGVCSTNDCDKSCVNCLVEDKYKCLTCNFKENYYALITEFNNNKDKGYFKCNLKNDYPHYFVNETDKTLVECSNNCETCIINENYCTNCTEKAYYVEGMNDLSCHFTPPGINWVLNLDLNIWQKCNERCNSCFKKTNSEFDQQCLSCNYSANYYPYQKDIDAWNEGNNKYKITGFNCYSREEVFDNYFLNPVNFTWTKCSKNCSKCENSPDNCLECNKNSEYYNIKNHKNGSCFKNPLPGYILDSENEFNTCFRTCKFCLSTSNSFFYMQCRECDEIKYTLSNYSYEKSYCIPKDNSSSHYLSEQLKWYITDYNSSEHYKIFDYEIFNDKKYENYDFILTYECPEDKKYIIYSIRQCVSKCSNPDDLIEYGLFFNKPLYVYGNICYDKCPYGSVPDNESMTCVEKNRYSYEELIIKQEFDYFYQENVDFYLANCANNTILQIQSYEFTNYFYNSSTNESWKYAQNMPIYDFENCIELLTEKYNYTKDIIHIGIFQNNDLKKENPNTMLLSAINSTSYNFFLSNGTILDFSICNDIKINVNKPLNISLIENFEVGMELLKNYNLSIFDTENNAFDDMCIPLELNGKDLSIYTRQNKLKSKMKVCDNDCNFLGIDYEKNYSLCECKIKSEKRAQIGFGDLLKDNSDIINNTLRLKDKTNIIIFKCLGITKFDLKNYIFYISLIFSITHFLSLTFYLKIFYKNLKIENLKNEGPDFNNSIQKRETFYKTKQLFDETDKKTKQTINNTIIYVENGKATGNKISNETNNIDNIDSNDLFNFKKKKNILSLSVPIPNSINNHFNKNSKKDKDNYFINLIKIIKKNISEKLSIEKALCSQTIIIIIQIIIFLLQSFLFWNGLLNTEEYITKRFDEKNKIGFIYILANEFNKYFFTSLFVLISLKLLKIFFEEIKDIKVEIIENKTYFDNYIFKKKCKIFLTEIFLSIVHIFFMIFLCIFGNIYPNNKNLLLISSCISIIFNFIIFLAILLISSLIMSFSFFCKNDDNNSNIFNDIGKYILNII